MSIKNYKLSSEAVEQIRALTVMLEGEADDLQGAYDNESEDWQDGNDGQKVAEWLDELDSFRSELETLNTEPS